MVQIFKRYFFEQRTAPPTEYSGASGRRRTTDTGTFTVSDWEMFQQFCSVHQAKLFYMKRSEQVNELLEKCIPLWHAFTVELVPSHGTPGRWMRPGDRHRRPHGVRHRPRVSTTPWTARLPASR